MKKLAIFTPALALGLALGACAEANAPAEDADGDTAMTEPAAGDTTIINEAPPAGSGADAEADGTTVSTDGNSVSVDGKDVDATVGEDGVKAKIKVD